MARKTDDLSNAKRDVRELRDIIKMLRTTKTNKFGCVEKWFAVVVGYEAQLKTANALVKTLTK